MHYAPLSSQRVYKVLASRKETTQMAVSAVDQFGRLLRGRELQFRAVVITALASYFLQLIGIWLHWALWAIALGTILPWIPLFTMKVLWTSKHYGFMALYLVIMILQAGHVGEHVVQMLQFIFIYSPHANPPCLGWSWDIAAWPMAFLANWIAKWCILSGMD